jgi:oligoendopeptidase F
MDWDLSEYFPAFDDPRRQQFEHALIRDYGSALEASAKLSTLAADNADAWEAVALQFEGLMSRLSHFSSYVHALVSAEGNNADYLEAEGRLSTLGAQSSKLQAQLVRGIGSASEEQYSAWLKRTSLAGAQHFLGRLRKSFQMSMPTPLEELAADLGTDGVEAWGRLYDGVMSALTFELQGAGEERKQLPFSMRRSLMEGNDRAVRKAAFEGGNKALEPWLPTLNRALNHISGTRVTLSKRRGISHILDVATFEAGISRSTLEALMTAVERQIEIPRQVLALKARQMGTDAVRWYDLGAPLPMAESPSVPWEQAVSRVKTAFHRQYPALAEYFDGAIKNRWVDYHSRPGKRPGAFCTRSTLLGQSRVFMTYGETLSDVSTLAHEMGHAFHGHILRKARPFASGYPMTLAESASIFAELVLVNGLLDDPELSAEQRSALYATLVNDAPIFLLDVNTRFQFERAFYDERTLGEVRLERTCELMRETQRRVFGSVLEPGFEDAYFWASKLHFFITGVSFYNYPYIFGYLLSRGLYARFKEEGPAFLPRYEQFLARSGSADPAFVAREALGCNLDEPDFWEQSIQSVRVPLQALQSS